MQNNKKWTKNWELTKQTYVNCVSLQVSGLWGGSEQQTGASTCVDRKEIDVLLSQLDFDSEPYLAEQRNGLVAKVRSSSSKTVFDVTDCVEFYSDRQASLDGIRQNVRRIAKTTGVDVTGVYQEQFRDFSEQIRGQDERANEAWKKHLEDIKKNGGGFKSNPP